MSIDLEDTQCQHDYERGLVSVARSIYMVS